MNPPDSSTQMDLPMGDPLDRVFREIETDRSRGSRELTAYLLEELLIWALEKETLDHETLRSICETITTLRPEMAAVSSTGYILWSRVDEQATPEEEISVFREVLQNLRTEREEADQQLFQYHQLAEFSEEIILTFSRSSTVLSLIQQHDQIKKAIVLHSFPGEEGIDMAEDLGRTLDVTFAYDVEAGYFLPKVDALYVGVDCLFHDGSIVNKTGTRLLAAASGQTSVRCVTDVWKLTRNDAVTDVPEFPSPEGVPKSQRREHPIFETIQPELIDTYVTNRGVFHTAETLIDELKDIREAQKSLFTEI